MQRQCTNSVYSANVKTCIVLDLSLSLEESYSLCQQQGLNWSLPVIQTEEAHQSLVRFMMEHNISSAWLGWKSVELRNWTWINDEICE